MKRQYYNWLKCWLSLGLAVCILSRVHSFLFLLLSKLSVCAIFFLFPPLHTQALERQKEFFDSIRSERDDLREEIVKLKEELKV
jgi:hypothetical protein